MKKNIIIILLLIISSFAFSQIPNPPALISPPNNTTGINPDSVLLDWSDVTGALSYRVQVSLNSIFTAIVVDENTNNSQYSTQPGMLSSLTLYYWRVNVTTAGGTSNWSNSFTFTTRQGTPGTPFLINPLNGQTGVPINVTFTWTSIPTATAYIIHVSKSPLFDSLVVCDTTPPPLGTITLEYSTTYYWRVCGMNSGGVGPWSSVFNFTTVMQLPSAPMLISPPDNSNVTLPVTLDWSDVPTATGYRVQVSLNSSFTQLILVEFTTVSQYTFMIDNLQQRSLYYWRVAAMNPGGTGPYSNIWRFYTGSVTPPDPPVLLSPCNSNNVPVSGVTFDWTDVPTAVSYRIQISFDSNFVTTFVNQVINGISQYTHNTPIFANNTIYYWRVNTTNSGGTGQWSSVCRFVTVPAALLPPSLIYPCGQNNVSLTPTLDWTDVPGATSYRVVINPSFPTPLFDTIVVPSQVTIPPGKLTYFSTYFWRVSTINNGGQGSWSVVCNFTTISQSGIKLLSSEIPAEYKLYDNYPNPFNPNTIIKFQIKDLRFVTLRIYNVIGKEIVTLVNEKLSPGIYEVSFDGSDLPSGIYFYTIRSGDPEASSGQVFTDTKRMMLVK